MHRTRPHGVATRAALIFLMVTALMPDGVRAEPTGAPSAGQPVQVSVDGRSVDVGATVLFYETHVPLRSIVAALGGTITWDPAARSASVRRGHWTAVLIQDQPAATANGRPVRLSSPPVLYAGLLVASARDVARLLGLDIAWDIATHTVRFTSTPKRVLFFTKSSGFEHSVVKHNEGEALGWAERILTELGTKNGLEITCTKDGTMFTPENIAKFDLFVFYTTGDLTTPGTDKQPPMTPEAKDAFLQAIRDGKGFVGVHSATDTFHNNKEVDPYIAMIGGEFYGHGKQQVARMAAADSKFPGCEDCGAGFELFEEWYSFKNHALDLHVILAQETKGMDGWQYERGSFPATWARMHGKGRVFYTSMGHREDVWTNPVFQTVLLGGIDWALRRKDAAVPPTVELVTPKYLEIPKQPAKK